MIKINEPNIFYKRNHSIDDWYSLFIFKFSNYDITLFIQEEDVQPIVDEVFIFFEKKQKKWGEKTIEIGCAYKGSSFYSDNGIYKLIDDNWTITLRFIAIIIEKYDYSKYIPIRIPTITTATTIRTTQPQSKSSFFNIF